MTPGGSGMLHWLARAGYAARGVVYLVVGYLAALAAWTGSRPEGPEGALRELWGGPAGTVMLVAIGVGLLLFSAWRLLQALLDRDGHGRDAKALAIRAGLLASAVTYALLALFALGYLAGRGGGGGGGEGGSRGGAAFLLSQPFGRALLGLVALVIVGIGLAHLWKAWRRGYLKRLEMSEAVKRWASPVSRFGLFMRGITFLIVAGFFFLAAFRGQPEEAAGLAEALQAVQEMSYGWVALAVIALGLFAFGLYSLIEAVWRRVDLPPAERLVPA